MAGVRVKGGVPWPWVFVASQRESGFPVVHTCFFYQISNTAIDTWNKSTYGKTSLSGFIDLEVWFIVAQCHCFGPVAALTITVWAYGRWRPFVLWWEGRRRRKERQGSHSLSAAETHPQWCLPGSNVLKVLPLANNAKLVPHLFSTCALGKRHRS